MRFYQQEHPFYCGVDLHARSMHVCIVDAGGQTRLHQNIDARPDRFRMLIGPYREGLTRIIRDVDLMAIEPVAGCASWSRRGTAPSPG